MDDSLFPVFLGFNPHAICQIPFPEPLGLQSRHYSLLFLLSSVTITAGRTPGFEFTFNALEFYRHNKSMFGINTLVISLHDAVATLTQLKPAFEAGELQAPSNLEEADLADEQAVLAAYEKVKGGSKAKQILVNKNV